MNTENRKKIIDENKAVLSFIKDWQSKNEYNPVTLDQYNQKFNIEFNEFLTKGNFSKKTIELFKTT